VKHNIIGGRHRWNTITDEKKYPFLYLIIIISREIRQYVESNISDYN